MPELIPAAPGSPGWLAARRQGVTETDIVTILGLSSWSSPYSLFWQKLGQVPETPDNDRFRLGRYLEAYVVDRWAAKQDEAYYGSAASTLPAIWRHSERAWQLATPDRVITDKSNVIVAVLEVKTWADADRHSWQDGPPPAVRAQILWQMDVMDVATGHVGVVFLPSGEFRSYVIEHSGAACGRLPVKELAKRMSEADGPTACDICTDLALMRAAGEEFMARLRLELPAPDPDASAATLAAVKARFARQPDKEAEISHADWLMFKAFKDEAAKADDAARGYEIQLREQAGEASVYTVDGQPVARRITGDSPVKAHVRHSDYLKRIVREPVTDEHTNGIGEQQ